MQNYPNSSQEIFKKMKKCIQKVEKENPSDAEILVEMFHKIKEIREKIPYFQGGIGHFRDFYQNEIENFFDENIVLSKKNEEIMCEYMINECQEMEAIVKKQLELQMMATALNRVQMVLSKK